MTNARDVFGEYLPDADRLTPLGSFLRRTSLDEVPQLWNVFRGDMSLVGPRPLFVRYVPFYSLDEARRHQVRPGLTGLAQVSGRNQLGWDDRLRIDTTYVDTMSLAGDLRILWRTLKKAVTGEDVLVIPGQGGEALDVERSYPREGGLALRRFAERDIPDRVQWMSTPAIMRYMRLPSDVTEHSTRSWHTRTRRDLNRHDFVVFDDSTQRNVAMMGLKVSEDRTLPELYIFVDPHRHGKGIGAASLTLLLLWIERSGAYEGCQLGVSKENVGAIALYERLGFFVTKSDAGRLHMQIATSDWRKPK